MQRGHTRHVARSTWHSALGALHAARCTLRRNPWARCQNGRVLRDFGRKFRPSEARFASSFRIMPGQKRAHFVYSHSRTRKTRSF